METPKESTVHSMKRRSFTHEYSYRGYFHVTFSTAAHLLQPLGRVCGDIDAADDEAEAPHVELTPFGQMVEQELLNSITRHYPMIEVDTYVIMPEHLHILLHAKRDIFSSNGKRTHLGRVIAGFKQGCNRRYWEMTGRISGATKGSIAEQGEDLATKSPGAIAPTTDQMANTPVTPQKGQALITPQTVQASITPQKGQTPITPQTVQASITPQKGQALMTLPSGGTIALNDLVVEHHPSVAPLPPLFEQGYCDVIPVDDAQLATQRAYILNNPRSRLLRTSNRASLMPRRGGIDTGVSLPAMCGFLRRVCPEQLFTPAIWQQLQARFLMENGHIRCDSYGDRTLLQRRLLPVVCHRNDAALFTLQKSRCLAAAATGIILVSARIARGEQEIMDAALTSGYPVIQIEDNGLPDRFHPSVDKLDACAANHLLLVTPWHYLFRKKDDAIHVPLCKAMNCIAQALSRTKDDWWKDSTFSINPPT